MVWLTPDLTLLLNPLFSMPLMSIVELAVCKTFVAGPPPFLRFIVLFVFRVAKDLVSVVNPLI